MGLDRVGAGGVDGSTFNALAARVSVVEADNLNLVEHSVNTDGTSLSVDLSKSKTYKIAFDTAATLAVSVGSTEAPADEISVNFLDIVATADGLLTINGETYLITDGVNYSIAIEDVAGTSTLQTNLPVNPVGDDYANLTGYVTSDTKEISIAGQAHYVTSTTVTGVTGNDPTTADQHDPANGDYVYRLADSPTTYKLFSIHQATVASLHPDAISYLRSAYRAVLTTGGVIDNYSALQSQINLAAAAYIPIYVDAGNYYVSDTILLPSNAHVICHPDAKFIFPYDIEGSGGQSSDGVGFFAYGSIGSEVALTANVAKDATSVTVASASGFAAGDLVMIGADEILRSNVNRAGELAYIKSISSGTITLLRPLKDAYTTANTAFIQKITPKTNIKFWGGQIESDLQSGTPLVRHVGFRAEYCVGVEVKGVVVREWNTVGIEFAATLNGIVDGCTGYDIGWDGSAVSSAAYFLQANQATEGAIFQNSNAYRCGKVFDCSGSSSRHGIIRNITVQNCHGHGLTRQLFGLHANAQGVRFINVTGDAVDGCHIRGSDVELIDCKIDISGGEAVRWQPQGKAGYFKMRGGYIRSNAAGALGIYGVDATSGDDITEDMIVVHIDSAELTCASSRALEIIAQGLSDISYLVITNCPRIETAAADRGAIYIQAEDVDITNVIIANTMAFAPNLNSASLGAIHFEANTSRTIGSVVMGANVAKSAQSKITEGGAGTIDVVNGTVQT